MVSNISMTTTWMNTGHKSRHSCRGGELLRERLVRSAFLIIFNLAPKIWVTEDLGGNYRDVMYQQRLAPIEILYDERHLERLFEADDVNSQYV